MVQKRDNSDGPQPVKTRCPQCRRQFQYDRAHPPKWLPFCCDRCQWVDLGRWMSDEYTISRPLTESDDEQQD